MEKTGMSTKTILKIFSVIVTVLGGISIGFVAYGHWKDKIWKPKVKILDVDFNTGEAHFEIDGETKTLIGESTIAIAADWGIRFGSTFADGKKSYNRIELVKNNMVYQTVLSSNEKLQEKIVS